MSFHVRSYSCNVNKIYIWEISRAIVNCMQLLQKETWEFIFRKTCVSFDWEPDNDFDFIQWLLGKSWTSPNLNHDVFALFVVIYWSLQLLPIPTVSFKAKLQKLPDNERNSTCIRALSKITFFRLRKSDMANPRRDHWLLRRLWPHHASLQPDTYSWSSTQLRLDYVRRSMSQERHIKNFVGFQIISYSVAAPHSVSIAVQTTGPLLSSSLSHYTIVRCVSSPCRCCFSCSLLVSLNLLLIAISKKTFSMRTREAESIYTAMNQQKDNDFPNFSCCLETSSSSTLLLFAHTTLARGASSDINNEARRRFGEGFWICVRCVKLTEFESYIWFDKTRRSPTLQWVEKFFFCSFSSRREF